MRIGYARCSTDGQDVEVQRGLLASAGVDDDRIYVDRGLSGADRSRPGLEAALAAVRDGDTLVVTKLDRLARSLTDLTDLSELLTGRGVVLEFDGTTHKPDDPMGRMFFQILGVVAEFERNLLSQRTREGMAVARAKGRLKGRGPKLSQTQAREVARMHSTGDYTVSEIAELFNVDRATIYRTLRRIA